MYFKVIILSELTLWDLLGRRVNVFQQALKLYTQLLHTEATKILRTVLIYFWNSSLKGRFIGSTLP